MRALILRFVAVGVAGLAALLAVLTMDGQIADLATLFGAAREGSDYQKRAAAASAACGELGAERESCELSVMRLGGGSDAAPFGALHAGL